MGSAGIDSTHFKELPKKTFGDSGQNRPRACGDREMSPSKRSIEMLLDLVEIKISYMDVADREDARDLVVLERAREELRAITGRNGTLVQEAMVRRVGRPRVAA